ncbi:hypothetical protein [Gordonia sputi]|uniref:hypothetical protein n=1 Tax=Gordonia sputi TaxID=36823 RepID=UPI0036B76832
MADHLENTLRATIKSLRDVVGPAVDSADPMAQEQMALSLMALEFVRSRLDHLHARDRFLLQHYLQMGQKIADAVTPAPVHLNSALDAARAVVDQADVSDVRIRSAADAIAAAISDVVDSPLDEGTRREVDTTIVESSCDRIEFERAWHAPMGFDPDVASIASVEAAASVYR